jgi:pSer/pThr/pTyr-binding forkhead associated (FHA) protein
MFMPRLVVNPSSPASWEIQLNPGKNLIGRGLTNDFQIADPSVSGSHCRITVNGQAATIKDLGSTNGTYVNHAKVREMALQHGQTVHLGSIEMVYYSDVPAQAATKPVPRIAASQPPRKRSA